MSPAISLLLACGQPKPSFGDAMDKYGCDYVSSLAEIRRAPPEMQGFLADHTVYVATAMSSASVETGATVYVHLPDRDELTGTHIPDWTGTMVVVCSMNPWQPPDYYTKQAAVCNAERTLCVMKPYLAITYR